MKRLYAETFVLLHRFYERRSNPHPSLYAASLFGAFQLALLIDAILIADHLSVLSLDFSDYRAWALALTLVVVTANYSILRDGGALTMVSALRSSRLLLGRCALLFVVLATIATLAMYRTEAA